MLTNKKIECKEEYSSKKSSPNDDIINEIKENLSIRIEQVMENYQFKNKLKVSLFFGNDLISEETCLLVLKNSNEIKLM